ncbi:MAG: hypothetical protein M3Z66_15235 [Chloroflexota bacterium]|nr:hypothetical protein [Chloroflexota bacterium]
MKTRVVGTGIRVRRLFGACTALVLALGWLSSGHSSAWAAPRAAAASKTCASAIQSANSSVICRIIPASGTFTLPIPGTPAELVGIGTPDRAGQPIVLARVPLVCQSLGGFGIRITTPHSAKLLPPLHWTNGTLYYRSTSGQCFGVQSPALAAAPGTYQVVAGDPPSVMPRTGGALPHPGHDPLVGLLLGMLLLLLGAAMRVLVFAFRATGGTSARST